MWIAFLHHWSRGRVQGGALPSDVEPSSLDLLLKFVYLTSPMYHSLVVHPILRKILDLPKKDVAKYSL